MAIPQFANCIGISIGPAQASNQSIEAVATKEEPIQPRCEKGDSNAPGEGKGGKRACQGM